jgi:CDGSH-type Zn-finger protein
MTALALTYVLPIKRSEASGCDDDLNDYLRWLAPRLPVVVADGSPAAVFAAHNRRWGDIVTHVRVTSEAPNGKVAGVCDGVAAARTEGIVIADDDVRYDEESLAAVARFLERHAFVMPQNYFDPAPWHARWDTGRSLLNRSVGFDYAGTVGVRRSAFAAAGGYCGAVLFENLELMRTISASGQDVYNATDVYVARRPPSFRQFLDQRVRQAYDSRAQPWRLLVELGMLPAALVAAALHPATLLVAAVMVVALAEVGRRRAGGQSIWPATSPVWSLGWVVERSITAWLATGAAARGGVRYRGRRLRVAAHRLLALAKPGCPERACVCRLPQRAGAAASAARPYVVTECPDGPLLVRGAAAVRDAAGVVHATTRPVVAVCRCEKSARLPWCDGTHKVARQAVPSQRDGSGTSVQIIARDMGAAGPDDASSHGSAPQARAPRAPRP